MVEMLDAFTKGYQEYGSRDPDPKSTLEVLQSCYLCLAEQKEGLARLRKGDTTGFKLIRGLQNGFLDTFTGRYADEHGFYDLGRDFNDRCLPGTGLWSWMHKIIAMGHIIDGVLWGHRSYPRFDVSKYNFPDQIGGYPLAKDVFIKTGDDIPVTGVWQPISFKSGCPNFLIQGDKAPVTNLPTVRRDTPAWDQKWGKGRIEHHEARTFVEWGKFPTVWQLIEEDNRWRNGREPLEESDYLLWPDTDLPQEPPVAPQNPPKFF